MELCERLNRVEELLKEDWQPTAVTLCALVNAAGERRDWQRALELWERHSKL